MEIEKSRYSPLACGLRHLCNNRCYPALWFLAIGGNINQCPRRIVPRQEAAVPVDPPSSNLSRPRSPLRGLIIMFERMSQAKRTLALLAALVGLLLIPMRAPAEPVAGKQDRLVVQMVCEFLHRGHL